MQSPINQPPSPQYNDTNQKKSKIEMNFKVVFLGSVNVGKTSIMYRGTDGSYKENREPTLGVACAKKLVERKGLQIKLEIWDTAGQEKFKNIAPIYFRNSSCVVIVYDITSKESFEGAKFWLKEVENYSTETCMKYLVGNKLDFDSNRQVDIQQAQTFAEQNNLYYIEVSAKMDVNINRLFRRIARFLAKRYLERLETIESSRIQYLDQKSQSKNGFIKNNCC